MTGQFMTKQETAVHRRFRDLGLFAMIAAITIGGFCTMAFIGMGFQFSAELWVGLIIVSILLLVALAAFRRGNPSDY